MYVHTLSHTRTLQAIAPANQAVSPLTGFPLTLEHVEAKLAAANVAVLHKKVLPAGGHALYCTCESDAGHVLLCEIQVTRLPLNPRLAGPGCSDVGRAGYVKSG